MISFLIVSLEAPPPNTAIFQGTRVGASIHRFHNSVLRYTKELDTVLGSLLEHMERLSEFLCYLNKQL